MSERPTETTRETEPSNRSFAFLKFGAAVAAITAIVHPQNIEASKKTLDGYFSRTQVEELATQRVSDFVRDKVHITCEDTSDTLDLDNQTSNTSRYEVSGYVLPFRLRVPYYSIQFASRVVTLHETLCHDIANNASITEHNLRAYTTATHEYLHTKDIGASEAKVTCYTSQMMPSLLAQTGVSEVAAKQMITDQTQQQEARVPDEYLDPSRCAPGKEYDLNLKNGVYFGNA